MQFTERDFESIRPYKDEEVKPALERISKDPVFFKALEYLFDEEKGKYLDIVSKISTTHEFQTKFMYYTIKRIIEKTSDGATCNGFENLSPDKSYLFISNHRDIFLDSALLQFFLVDHGFNTSQISFGNNLMSSPLLTDIAKVNKMFTVIRDGGLKERYINSCKLSDYIRRAIVKEGSSVWIAQRSGRTKDGSDKTRASLLKMLNTSAHSNDFEKNFLELNIVPLSFSYEYEPCDVLKTQELYTSQGGEYKKKPGEDLNSILQGITNYKGRIHLEIGSPIGFELSKIANGSGDFFESLAELIDDKIYRNFKFWPTNYLAFDLLNEFPVYEEFYNDFEKEAFKDYLERNLGFLNGDKAELKQLLLNIYANPIKNFNNTLRYQQELL